jgi:hypothetical protein
MGSVEQKQNPFNCTHTYIKLSISIYVPLRLFLFKILNESLPLSIDQLSLMVKEIFTYLVEEILVTVEVKVEIYRSFRASVKKVWWA